MPPAIIAGGIAAIGTIGGAAIASGSQKKAANQAAASQQQATNSELQLGRENMAQQQQIYNSNFNLLSPFVSRGNVAGDNINALLGLPAAPTINSPLGGGTSGGNSQWAAYLQANPDVAAEAKRVTADGEFPSPEAFAQWHYQNHGQAEGRQLPTPPVAGQQPVSDPTQALNAFANSAGMQFQLQQGNKAIQNSAAAHGNLLSGATLKGLQNYGQQTALNNYFMPYLGLLGGQQSVGAGAGSAVAGVGTNFGNTVSSIYGGQQNAIQNGADAASNAALLKFQANNSLANGIGSGLGTLASSFMPSQGARY